MTGLLWPERIALARLACSGVLLIATVACTVIAWYHHGIGSALVVYAVGHCLTPLPARRYLPGYHAHAVHMHHHHRRH
jgi:Flp pilus assembly protein TadB